MTEYISREAAKKKHCEICMEECICYRSKSTCDELKAFDLIPSADVRPVMRGKWVAEKEDVEWGSSVVHYRCSNCGRLPHFDKESFKFLLSDFCPNCGADMREES